MCNMLFQWRGFIYLILSLPRGIAKVYQIWTGTPQRKLYASFPILFSQGTALSSQGMHVPWLTPALRSQWAGLQNIVHDGHCDVWLIQMVVLIIDHYKSMRNGRASICRWDLDPEDERHRLADGIWNEMLQKDSPHIHWQQKITNSEIRQRLDIKKNVV